MTPDGTLTINAVRHEDAGIYTCVARNEHGMDMWSENLTVIGKYFRPL